MAMHCRACHSKQTRVVTTETHGNTQKRWITCSSCGERFITLERYAKPKPGPARGTPRRNINYSRSGEDNPGAYLTAQNIYALRRAYDSGLTYAQIAAQFGIASSTYYRIGKRTSWSHLPER